MRRSTKKAFMIIGLAAIALAFFMFSQGGGVDESRYNVTLYSTPTCGCCRLYGDYMEKDFNVETVMLPSIEDVNKELGVPEEVASCHTSVVEGYFVSGHIPKEAVDRLLRERPDIKGIGMGGMPSGSPGMPGAKYGPFIIYQIDRNGTLSEYMRL